MSNLIAFCQQIKNQEGKAEIYIHYRRSCAIVGLFVLQSSTDKRAHLHVAKLEQTRLICKQRRIRYTYLKHP